MEVHYLGNQDGDLYFALLSDWVDSPTEAAADDDELLSAATDSIADLNRRYGPAPNGPRFFLLHRRRMWNEGQGKWIGWERKRGKLHELNRWLRGATDTTFVTSDSTISAGQVVCVRHTSSATPATTVDTTLTIGGVSDSFRSIDHGDNSGEIVVRLKAVRKAFSYELRCAPAVNGATPNAAAAGSAVSAATPAANAPADAKPAAQAATEVPAQQASAKPQP